MGSGELLQIVSLSIQEVTEEKIVGDEVMGVRGVHVHGVLWLY